MNAYLSDPSSLSTACEKLAGLDIYKERHARTLFLKLALQCVRSALKKEGIDINREGTYDDYAAYCDWWFRNITEMNTDDVLPCFCGCLSAVIRQVAHKRRNART